jgi:hypothetical protein
VTSPVTRLVDTASTEASLPCTQRARAAQKMPIDP